MKQAGSQFGDAYSDFLSALAKRIQESRASAVLSINQELSMLYWDIGHRIREEQTRQGWGAQVIEQLSQDLSTAFPDTRSFSVRNLRSMRAFSEAYSDSEIVKQLVSQIPWGHNLRLIQTVKDPEARLWYAHQTIEHGWSRAVLVHQIESSLYDRQGKALTNFEHALPATQSDLARELLKDPYNLAFLGLSDDISERELERSLLNHLKEFLLELGKGFAFMGSQYRLEVGGQDYYLYEDLAQESRCFPNQVGSCSLGMRPIYQLVRASPLASSTQGVELSLFGQSLALYPLSISRWSFGSLPKVERTRANPKD